MARQARKESSTGIFHVMMRGINHQNIFEEPEDYYQFIATLDCMRVHYDEDGLMNEMLPDTVRCLDIEDSSRSRPSDDQVWQMIIEMVGVTNSSAFQVLEDKSKRMVLKELKDKGASYRQLERLTGVGRGLIQKL